MDILTRLQERLPVSDDVQRIVLFDRENGATDLSAVLVRVPADHEFSLHTHPTSEDCFFVLSGAGEALEPARNIPISAAEGIWIPAGHPHGLRASSGGMLEIGFQSPADHTAVPFDDLESTDMAAALVKSSLPDDIPSGQWCAAFPKRSASRYLDAQYARLDSAQPISIGSWRRECAVLVVSGEIELIEPLGRSISATGAIRLDAQDTAQVTAKKLPALLIRVAAT